MKTKFLKFFQSGHQRSIKAKKNILASFIIKGLNIVLSLILVPLTIGYLNPTRYGIWITMSSIIGWFGFFDIGLGNGLRNRFAQAIAQGNQKLARTYVSTTYAILTIIISSVLIIFYIINPLLNWSQILNTGEDSILNEELSLLAMVVFTFFCLRFIFKLITTILTADQSPAKASVFDLISKLLILIVIYILTKNTIGSLVYLGIVVSGIPVAVLLISSIWFYNGKYKQYKPSIKFIDFKKAGNLLNLGVKFFIIQIAAVLLYQTNNIIISQLFGPEEVTPYNVSFKYFNVLMMAFSIIISPFWSAITEAWTKNEYGWIKNSMSKLFKVWLIICLLAYLMIIFSKIIYKFWVGEDINISFLLSLFVAIWVLINAWNGIFSQFLNGVGKIRIQLISGILAAIINVPLALLLGRNIGVEGVVLANILVLLFSAVIFPIQYNLIINLKAKGIWNK